MEGLPDISEELCAITERRSASNDILHLRDLEGCQEELID